LRFAFNFVILYILKFYL